MQGHSLMPWSHGQLYSEIVVILDLGRDVCACQLSHWPACCLAGDSRLREFTGDYTFGVSSASGRHQACCQGLVLYSERLRV